MERLLRKVASFPALLGKAPFLLWDPAEVKCALEPMPGLELSRDQYRISTYLGEEIRQDVERMISRWPRQEETVASKPDTVPGRE